MTLPLSGITVLDLTRLLPAPMATRHLVDMGASVIKIQSPDPAQADYAKTMGQPSDMDGDASHFYRHCNAGKADLTLDLKNPVDRAQLLDLCKTADVVIESFRPGVIAKLGLDFATIQATNPAISLISISGYGQHGAWSGAAGHDINYMALSGMLHEFINADATQITLPNVQFGDLLGGAMTAAFATVSAVLHSKMHGKGLWMDVSMTASLLAHNVMPLFATQARGEPSPAGSDLLNGGVACYRAYRTADGRFLAVGALELKFWQVFCGAVNRPMWARQHWSLGGGIGNDEATALIHEVKALISSQTLKHWLDLVEGKDCCVTPVLSMDEALLHRVNVDFGTVGYVKAANGRDIPSVSLALNIHLSAVTLHEGYASRKLALGYEIMFDPGAHAPQTVTVAITDKEFETIQSDITCFDSIIVSAMSKAGVVIR